MMMDEGSLNINSSDINLVESEGQSTHDAEASNNDLAAPPPPHNLHVATGKPKGEPKKEGLKLRRKRKSRKNRSEFSRLHKKKEEILETVPPPVNTTQFLMSDYNFNKFSPDVKVDDYKDNEVEFLIKEFSKEYENTDLEDERRLEMRKNARCDRMASLNRDDLVHKYMHMDKEVKMLEMRLVMVKEQEEKKAREGEVEYDWRKGEVHMEPETAQKIRVFQNEIANLEAENKELLGRVNSSVGEGNGWTSDSSSDSNSSSSGGSGSSQSSSGGSDSSSGDSSQSDEVQSVVSNTCEGEEGKEDDVNMQRVVSNTCEGEEGNAASDDVNMHNAVSNACEGEEGKEDDNAASDDDVNMQSVVSNTCEEEEVKDDNVCDDISQSTDGSDGNKCDQVSGVKEQINKCDQVSEVTTGEENQEREADAKSDNINGIEKTDV